MKVFKENKVKTIILGCTHYPLFEQIIKNDFNYSVDLINTGKLVAKEVEKYIEKNELKNTGKKVKNRIIVSKEDKDFEIKAKNILKCNESLDITNYY